jgi:hypothetical protein
MIASAYCYFLVRSKNLLNYYTKAAFGIAGLFKSDHLFPILIVNFG